MDTQLVRWGVGGKPVLLFPTAGGDAEECERFLMIRVLQPLLEAGRVRIYSLDSVAGRLWLSGEHSPRFCSRVQNLFGTYVYREVVPTIRHDTGDPNVEILTAGASIGAFNALAAVCRYPDVFSTAVCMSGTYDLSRWLDGRMNEDFHFSSPFHFLPRLGETEQMSLLRRRLILLPTGEGRWEDPAQSWRMAEILGSKGVPNRVDPWGPDWDHDWPTWRTMLPKYLDELTR